MNDGKYFNKPSIQPKRTVKNCCLAMIDYSIKAVI